MQSSLSYPATPRLSPARQSVVRQVRAEIQDAAESSAPPREDVRRSPLPPADGSPSAAPRPMRIPRDRTDTPADVAAADRMFRALQRGDDVRMEKVNRVRAALESGAYEGVYEMEFALDIVADRLLDELML